MACLQPFRHLIFVLFAFCCLPASSYCQGHSSAIATGNIIDSGARPEVFAPGVVSTRYDEWASAFSPDGKTVYFARGRNWTICYAHNKGGVWIRPRVAAFSGLWRDSDPFISPDGKRLFFVSNRPLDGMAQDKPNPRFHLWYVDQIKGDEWGKPHHVEGGVNADSISDFGPSVSAKGTLYWCSPDRDGHKGMQGYYASWLGDHYGEPKLLSISGAESIHDPFIAPDESYLIFFNGTDLYISVHQDNGWSAAQKLGPQVNNGDFNTSPYVSRDGKTLYYSSGGNILKIPVHLPGYGHGLFTISLKNE